MSLSLNYYVSSILLKSYRFENKFLRNRYDFKWSNLFESSCEQRNEHQLIHFNMSNRSIYKLKFYLTTSHWRRCVYPGHLEWVVSDVLIWSIFFYLRLTECVRCPAIKLIKCWTSLKDWWTYQKLIRWKWITKSVWNNVLSSTTLEILCWMRCRIS